MSIINQMHQDFEQVQQSQPILADIPKAKERKKKILVTVTVLLFVSSLGLAYQVFMQQQAKQRTAKKVVTVLPVKAKVTTVVKPASQQKLSTPLLPKENIIVPFKVQQEKVVNQPSQATPVDEVVAAKSVKEVEPIKEIKPIQEELEVSPKKVEAPAQVSRERLVSEPAKLAPKPIAAKPKQHLEIKQIELSKAQLAQLEVNKAEKAQQQGDFNLAEKSRAKALVLQPQLNQLRQTQALYYYSQGEVDKAVRLLQKGAFISPKYPDFNLMLSRIALQSGDQKKAYLYLNQHPPVVQGNIDYYVSYAVLAQKFEKYQQAEKLYTSLLSQRPSNGRWRMSLAIAQDKQDKVELAIDNYTNALQQVDLSSNAKAYIKQRLMYLQNQ